MQGGNRKQTTPKGASEGSKLGGERERRRKTQGELHIEFEGRRKSSNPVTALNDSIKGDVRTKPRRRHSYTGTCNTSGQGLGGGLELSKRSDA